jgi:arylsulfatase
LAALRYNNWKVVFMVQRAHGAAVWEEPFVTLRMPKLFNLKMDPFEGADIHGTFFYDKWKFEHLYALVPAQVKAFEFLNTFKVYPPMQEVESFALDNVMKKVMSANNNEMAK